MESNKIVKLIGSILLCQLAGVIGSIFTFNSITEWYALLNKPFFVPPDWLFAPAWITLYTLMGISLFLALEKGLLENKNKTALQFFSAQLALNALWTILFFGLRNPLIALIEIIVLWFLILLTIKKFYFLNKKAAYLLIPYILWVSFASALNFAIWVLN